MNQKTYQGSSLNGYQMSQGYTDTEVDNNQKFYRSVLTWTAATLVICGLSALFIGPLVPPAMVLPISIAVLVGLMVASFVRNLLYKFADLFAIVVPAALGPVIYAVVAQYTSAGMGSVVINALLGTAMIFCIMAAIGWTSKKNFMSMGKYLFAIVLGLIAFSLLNIFLLKSAMISFVISIGVLIIFSHYIMYDLQAVKTRAFGDKASIYALNIFLDIYNIFISLLQILGFLSKD